MHRLGIGVVYLPLTLFGYTTHKKMEEMNTTTNDDAVVDCIVHASEFRRGDISEILPATRRIVDPPPKDVSCSITMCGNDECENPRMLRYCQNGHCIHSQCLESLFENAESLVVTTCPQCRSKNMVEITLKALPIPIHQFNSMWGDYNNVAMAISSVVPEIRGINMLPLLMSKTEDPNHSHFPIQ